MVPSDKIDVTHDGLFSPQMRQTSEALTRIAERLEALRRRADILEAELEADGCVAGNNLGELRL